MTVYHNIRSLSGDRIFLSQDKHVCIENMVQYHGDIVVKTVYEEDT